MIFSTIEYLHDPKVVVRRLLWTDALHSSLYKFCNILKVGSNIQKSNNLVMLGLLCEDLSCYKTNTLETNCGPMRSFKKLFNKPKNSHS